MTRHLVALRRTLARHARTTAIASAVALLAATGGLAWIAFGGGDEAATLPSAGVPTLVYAEFSETADRIYTAPADAPNDRTLLDTVPHAPGWAITPALAIVEGQLAFLVLPPEAPATRHAPAELWVMSLPDGARTRLAHDADLLVPPVFNRDGSALLYRTALLDERQEIVRVDLETRARRPVHVEESRFGVFPVGFDAEDRPLVARLSADGTDLLRIEHPDPAVLLRHLSDQIARDWRISPDGRTMSYLEPSIEREQVFWLPRVLDTSDGDALALEVPLAQYLAPVWQPSTGAISAGGLAGPFENGIVLLHPDGTIGALAAPASGFDLPIDWNPSGRWLAVRHFDGTSIADPGLETVEVLGIGGSRRTIDLKREVIVIGWFGA